MIGRTISHYKIIEKIGGGGMGIVYKAQDLKLDRFVALKFLPPHLTTSEEEKQRFIHEAKAASALQHNNICNIHEIDETEEGQLFICMDYYEGDTLDKKIKDKPLPIDEAVDITIQIAQGLIIAHESKIIHRDLKPANIMITERGEVKIVDFGLAKLAGQTKLTKEGTTLGTVVYMSPEQIRGDAVDHRTDIWSLGVIIYEMITGQLPFKGDYDQAIIYGITNETPEPITGLRSGVPLELERIVNRALSKDPQDRYQHADDLLSELNRLKKDSDSQKTSIKNTSERKKNVVIIPAIILSVVVLIIAGYLLIAPGEKSTSDWENSIAVLPFDNISNDPEQEYFCDGMTEQIITNLSKLGRLKVIARTSVMTYKNTDKQIPQIGNELNVANILEGSVRKFGDRIRVTAQLINTADGSHLWAEDFDRELEHIFEVQDDVSEAIATNLLAVLNPQEKIEIKTKRPSNTEAYELYLKGRHFRIQQTDESKKRAIEYFERSIAKDSTFAPAYAGLAKVYHLSRHSIVEAKLKVKQAIKKALVLDNTLPEAYMGLGDILESELNWIEAEKAYKHAIELNSGNSEAHYEYGWLLLRTGRLEEGLIEMKQALEFDPLSLLAHHGIGWAYYFNREYDKAIEYNLKALELDMNYKEAYKGLIYAYIIKNKYDKALEMLEKRDGERTDPNIIGYIYVKQGKREEALNLINSVQSDRRKALIYALLGEKDESFILLNKVCQENPYSLYLLKIFPDFNSLRSDPRYEELLRKIGLEP